FLQAEDGIRGRNVTGVQTCALPILASVGSLLGLQRVWRGVAWGEDMTAYRPVDPGSGRAAAALPDEVTVPARLVMPGAMMLAASDRKSVGEGKGGGRGGRARRR